MYCNRFASILVMVIVICSIIFCKESKKMNSKDVGMSTSVEWLTHVQSVIAKQSSGIFSACDKNSAPVVIEWKKMNIMSSDFAESMKSIWDIACRAYMPVEIQFLHSFPDVVQNEQYFKSFQPLFAQGVDGVDWEKAEIIMQDILKSHFVFDPEKLSDVIKKMFADDICFVAVVKDQLTGEALGFITFIIRASYAYGDVKVMSFGVDPLHQNRGLGKLLMSSIFNIIPSINRIFLCTRVTNDSALRVYQSWGFTTDVNPVLDHDFNRDHWSFLEYRADGFNVLQKAAETYRR
jgi:GNAT superfamily N-acetyltransferase